MQIKRVTSGQCEDCFLTSKKANLAEIILSPALKVTLCEICARELVLLIERHEWDIKDKEANESNV